MAVLDKSKSKPTITEALPSGNDNPTGPAFPNTSQRNRSVPRAQNPPSNQHDIHNLSVATGNRLQHAKALPGNPYDGHTLAEIVPDMEAMIGNGIDRILADAGYRGHNAPLSHKFKVYTSGQKRRMTPAIKREMKRRAAIEPVIGHLKQDHRMGRNYLTGRDGDRINAVLAAAGYNFSLLLRWFEELLRVLSLILWHALLAAPFHLTRCRKTFFTAD